MQKPVILLTSSEELFFGQIFLNYLLQSSDFVVKHSNISLKDNPNGIYCDSLDHVEDIDHEILQREMEDVSYLMIVPSSRSSRVLQVKTFLEVAKKSPIQFILLISFLRPVGPMGISMKRYRQDYDAIESIVELSMIPFAIFRSTIYHQVLLLFSSEICKNGKYLIISDYKALPLCWGFGKVRPISIINICTIALTILKDPLPYDRMALHFTGSESVDGMKLARIASETCGWQVNYLNISSDSCKRLLMDAGECLSEEMIEIFEEIRDGFFEDVNTSDLAMKLMGTDLQSIQLFFESNFETSKQKSSNNDNNNRNIRIPFGKVKYFRNKKHQQKTEHETSKIIEAKLNLINQLQNLVELEQQKLTELKKLSN